MKRPFLLLLICVVLSLGDFVYGSFSLWPLLDYQEEEDTKKLEILGPLLFWEKGPKGVQWGLRPFVSGSSEEGKDRIDFLYPLGRFEERENGWKFFFFPFLKAYSDEDQNFFSFFTFFWGHKETGETYGGIFPFYGAMDLSEGKRREFLLWPFFGATYERDFTVYKFFWPFFKIYEGEIQGLDVWPFFSHRKSNSKGSAGFILWPFYIWRKKDTDLGPFSLKAYFPFYARLETPFSQSDFLLPPFLYHQRKHLEGSERFELWPFWALDKNELKIWPLWRHLEKEGKKRNWILWPLYSYGFDSSESSTWETERFFTLWHKEEKGAGKEYRTTVFWPFFRLKQDGGGIYFTLPSLIPLEDEGVQRNITPLLSFVEYKEDTKGFCFDLGWGLLTVKRKGEKTSFKVAFLAEGEFQRGHKHLRFLLRLFGLKKDPDKRWRIRVFDFF